MLAERRWPGGGEERLAQLSLKTDKTDAARKGSTDMDWTPGAHQE